MEVAWFNGDGDGDGDGDDNDVAIVAPSCGCFVRLLARVSATEALNHHDQRYGCARSRKHTLGRACVQRVADQGACWPCGSVWLRGRLRLRAVDHLQLRLPASRSAHSAVAVHREDWILGRVPQRFVRPCESARAIQALTRARSPG